LKAHIVKVSLSAWDQASYGWVNRPHPDLDFKQLMTSQKVAKLDGTVKSSRCKARES
jgi:wyosine [tRNA(Phe)-imidazoG37] synthetase (radical SAM superfamily)